MSPIYSPSHCHRQFCLLPAALLFLLLGGVVSGQDVSTYYTVMHPDEFAINWKAFYDRLDQITAEMKQKLTHHLDLPFGDHPKQRLDIYLPEGRARRAPVFLFFHGGGFREGDRAHYGAVARGFSQHGIITVVAGYRLTSQGYHFPDQAEDGQRALAWIYHNIRRYGGDPEKIFVGGHSAGALLTAEVTVKTSWLRLFGLPENLVKGALPVSGRYGERPEGDELVVDPRLRQVAQPIHNLQNRRTPFLVAVGSPEAESLKSSQEFVEALKKVGVRAELLVLDGETHDQTGLSLTDPDRKLFQEALRLILEK